MHKTSAPLRKVEQHRWETVTKRQIFPICTVVPLLTSKIILTYPLYVKDKAEVSSNCETSDLADVYRGAPSKAIVYKKKEDVSNLPDVHKGTPEKNVIPWNKVGSSFKKTIPTKKRSNTFNRCNKNNI